MRKVGDGKEGQARVLEQTRTQPTLFSKFIYLNLMRIFSISSKSETLEQQFQEINSNVLDPAHVSGIFFIFILA